MAKTKYKILSFLSHDGKDYKPDETPELDLSADQEKLLIGWKVIEALPIAADDDNSTGDGSPYAKFLKADFEAELTKRKIPLDGLTNNQLREKALLDDDEKKKGDNQGNDNQGNDSQGNGDNQGNDNQENGGNQQ